MTILDGNGNVFRHTLGLAESENVDTWSWFISLVSSAIHDETGRSIVVLSDRERGIELALTQFWPQAHHGFSAFHIQKN